MSQDRKMANTGEGSSNAGGVPALQGALTAADLQQLEQYFAQRFVAHSQASPQDPLAALKAQLRKIKPDGIKPLDAGDQGAAYKAWTVDVERVLFLEHGLWEIITGETPCPPGPADSFEVLEWNMKDKAAVMFLRQAMTPTRTERIPPTSHAAEVWAQLKANSSAFTIESLHATLSHLMDSKFDPEEEDVEAFWARITALYDELNEAEDEGFKIYPMTPAFLVSVLLRAIPETWGELARDLRQIRPSRIELQDLLQRMRAFELNTRAQAGAANRVGVRNNTPPSTSGQQQGQPGRRMCTFCSRGFHPESICYTKIRADYIKHNPGKPSPSTAWIHSIVQKGNKLGTFT